MTRYEPADSFETPRFSDVRTFMRLPNTRDLPNADAAIVGAPFDTGATFRAGARFGPEGIRSVSHLLRHYNPSLDVAVFDHISVIDYGDVPVVPGYIESSYERIAKGLEPIHRAGVVPIVLGGDHSIALPELRAAAAVHGPLALVQFDSHPDTWDSYFGERHTHGTPFRRAVEEGLLDTSRSIQVGMRGSIYDRGDWDDAREMGFDLVPTDEVRELGIPSVIDRISGRTEGAKVYVSFDVDFVDPAYAPGTGTPEIGGFTSREAQEFVRGLAGLEIVGCDVVEVYPAYDHAQITALFAANVAHEVLSLIAFSRKTGKA
ncbi:MAG TPA: agmatinase [Rubrobacter sp.]|nr:agmatinase [Rubrobacter sp.]